MTWKLSLALLLLALGLSFLAAANDRLPGDLWLARQAQDLGGEFEPIAEAARAVTATQTVLVLGVLLAALVLWRGERRLGAVTLAAIVVLPFLQAGIKNVVERPRPSAELVERRTTFTSESFPSGHTMSGTVLFLLLALALIALVPHRPWRIASIAAGAGVLAISMAGDLHLGVHWPSDVVGGLLWAGVLVAATVAVAGRAWPRETTSPGT